MKQHSRIFFLLFAFILLLYGCKPDDTGPNVSDEEYKALKEYVYFKPGTYWIYQDSKGNVDSMFVYDAGEGLDTADGYRYFTCRIHSTFDTYNYYISYNSGWTSFHPTQNKVFLDKTKGGDYVGQIILLLFPADIGAWRYWNDNKTTTADYNESYALNSFQFNAVIKMNDSSDITNEYRQETNYYLAKNVGIIQEDLIDSSNAWKLIRYNIVQ